MSSHPTSNRREFLVGRAAGDALAHVVEEAAEHVSRLANQLDPPIPEFGQRTYVSIMQRRAMACSFEIRFNAESNPPDTGAAGAGMAAFDLIEELEDQLSIYRDSSEICHINRKAADAPVEVESGLFELLAQAERIYYDTNGAFDLTSGPLSRVWGFHTRQGRLPSEEELSLAQSRVGWNNVQLAPTTREISFRQPGIEINVNSIGKGYALDRAAALLTQHGVKDFLFHGGRSSLIAQGRCAGEDGWVAGLRHPVYPRLRLALFRLRNEALSTSGSATQYFRHRGKRYGHLIDPRTGRPAEGLHSVTVIAPTAAEADALSTAFYVMGPEATAEYCRQHSHLKVLMVLPTSREGEVEVECLNLDDREWQPVSLTS